MTKLAELTDRGIPVHLFIGNHDMWIFDYVPKETGVIVHREPIERTIDGKQSRSGQRRTGAGRPRLQVHEAKVFRNPDSATGFARLPNFGLWLGFRSGRSRKKSYANDLNGWARTRSGWCSIARKS
ncbi:MAG: hypothetical protein IPH63_12905 [Flavobacteriales bacterium]|nr:hypothetical protein [Flavobacteriales bacterium]